MVLRDRSENRQSMGTLRSLWSVDDQTILAAVHTDHILYYSTSFLIAGLSLYSMAILIIMNDQSRL